MKTFVKCILTIVIAGLFATQIYAQETKPAAEQKQQQVKNTNGFTPGVFVDNDNNGICDNFESGRNVGRGRNFVDQNGDGICDHRGSKFGKGRGQGNNCRYANYNGHRGNRGRGNGYCRRNANY